MTDYLDLYPSLAQRTDLRFHISIESDLDRLPGLPPPFSTVEKRINAARILRESGFRVVITVSPLFPIRDPDAFFARLAKAADAVVIDHFIGGDGTPTGSRTLRTRLPKAARVWLACPRRQSRHPMTSVMSAGLRLSLARMASAIAARQATLSVNSSATEKDFHKATHRLYRRADAASALTVQVLPGPGP